MPYITAMSDLTSSLEACVNGEYVIGITRHADGKFNVTAVWADMHGEQVVVEVNWDKDIDRAILELACKVDDYKTEVVDKQNAINESENR